jgi:hypothetical protein
MCGKFPHSIRLWHTVLSAVKEPRRVPERWRANRARASTGLPQIDWTWAEAPSDGGNRTVSKAHQEKRGVPRIRKRWEVGTSVTPQPRMFPWWSNSVSGNCVSRRSNSSWSSCSLAPNSALVAGFPRLTCCTIGRQRSSYSQRNCSARRCAIISSGGCCCIGFPPCQDVLVFAQAQLAQQLSRFTSFVNEMATSLSASAIVG